MTEQVIVSTKDRPGSYDAIETAKPDEPLFPIQGGDPFGPPTVIHWAELARAAGMAEEDPKRRERLLRKAHNAEQVAWAMREYQRGESDQAGQRAQYNEAAPIEVDQDSDHDRAVRIARIKGVERLHNMAAQGMDVVEALQSLGALPAEATALLRAIEAINLIADAIEPRRENERT